MRVRRQAITKTVSDLLEKHGIKGPPVPVEVLAERLGLEITRSAGKDDLSGFLLKNTANGRAVIGVNANHHFNRQRFTIAHELGHYLMHDGEPLHVDALASYRVERRSTASSQGEHPKEIEANAFAAELLMPTAFLRRDLEQSTRALELSDDESVRELAERYQVSVAAMTFRLGNLGFIRL